jgi:VanZ family protein
VVLYAGAVIALSSIPYLNQPPIRILAADKIAHFIEYGIFAWLVFRSFSNISTDFPLGRAFVYSTAFIFIFALFDEFYQRFVPGRQFDIYDLVTDAGGALLVLLLVWTKKKRERPSSG